MPIDKKIANTNPQPSPPRPACPVPGRCTWAGSLGPAQARTGGQQAGKPGRAIPGRLWRWFSTGLIVAGLLLLVAGGLMAYMNSATPAEPPPAVGVVETLAPPSMEENPLPVVTGEELPGAGVSEATPTLTPTSTPLPTATSSTSLPVLVPNTPVAVPEDPAVPTPTPTSAPVPPAADPPTRIVAPAIKLDAEVVPVGWKTVIQDGKAVSVWEVAEYAAGWHKNSSLPGGGGNIVLSGHHNIKGEVFRYLVDLNPGDTLTLYADNRPYTYTVEARFVVPDKGVSEEQRRENARWIGPFPDERLTLVTCWPYTNNTHRVIVIAKPAG
jgi:sortase A